MAIFSNPANFSEQKQYVPLLKKALLLVKPENEKRFLYFHDFPFGTKKFPLVLVDFDMACVSSLAKSGYKPAAEGTVKLTEQDELNFEATKGRLKRRRIKKYFATLGPGIKPVFVPADEVDDDAEESGTQMPTGTTTAPTQQPVVSRPLPTPPQTGTGTAPKTGTDDTESKRQQFLARIEQLERVPVVPALEELKKKAIEMAKSLCAAGKFTEVARLIEGLVAKIKASRETTTPTTGVVPPTTGPKPMGTVMERRIGVEQEKFLQRQRAENEKTFAEARAVKQNHRSARLKEALEPVKRSYFRPGAADQIGKEKLKAGKEFKAFLEALKAVEGDKSETNLAKLEAAAQAYLKHYAVDLSDRERKHSESQRKKQICETALKQVLHWRLAEEQGRLPAPPWDVPTESRASELYAKMLFEEGDLPAAPNKKSGESSSWWIEKPDWGDRPEDTRQKKTFIFKPIDSEAEVDGFPKGGSAAREVLGKTVNDSIQAMTGLNFGVPETQLAAIDNAKLPDATGQTDETRLGQQRVGSIQHFAKSGGELRDVVEENPKVYEQMPRDEVHKAAVLDMITLNLDRHSGNFMVGEKDDGKGGKASTLMPIDHGLILPSREGLNARRAKMATGHNALTKFPAKNEKFSPEMQAQIEAIDPDAVVTAMQESIAAMKARHPQTKPDEMVTPESLKLTKRSIEFLKRAAGELTAAELQNALMVSMEEIFDSNDSEKEEKFAQAIAAAKERGAARRQFDAMETDALNKFCDRLHDLGWCIDFPARSFKAAQWDAWLDFNAPLALRFHDNRVENQPLREELDALIEEIGDPKFALKMVGLGLRSAIDEARQEAKNKKGTAPRPGADELKRRIATLGGEAELKKCLAELPHEKVAGDEQILSTSIELWEKYRSLGGTEMFFRRGGDGEITMEQRMKTLVREIAVQAMERQSPEELFQKQLVERMRRLSDVFESIKENAVRMKLRIPLGNAQAAMDNNQYPECADALDELEKEMVKTRKS